MTITPIETSVQRSEELGNTVTPWQKVANINLTLAINEEMLSSRGYYQTITCKLKTEKKGMHCAKQRLVRFDADYVSWKLENYLYQRLGNKYQARACHAVQATLQSMLKKLPNEF